MTDPVEVARQHARRLHRRAQAHSPDALTFLHPHPELRSRPLDALPAALKRRHVLARLAVALGCRGWPHLKAVLEGTPVVDKGRIMYRESAGYWNVWSASYEEAKRIRAEHGGFLLPFRRQFFVAEASYVRWMGGEPDAEEWSAIERDWVHPPSGQSTAWRRLTSRVLETRLSQAASG